MLRPLGRPKSISDDSGIDFGLILASFFHQKIILFRKSPKARKPWKTNEKSMILHLKTSHFRIDFWSKFHACSKRVPKPLFSTRWPPKCTNKSPYWIFWTAFGTSSDFQGPQKGPSKPESLKKSIWGAHFFGSWSRTYVWIGFAMLLGTNFVDFGWIFNGF